MHLVAVGGSDASISAALRARELDPTADVTVVVANANPEFGALVRTELERHGLEVHTRSTVTRISRTDTQPTRLHVDGLGPDDRPLGWDVDLVLAVVGVRPDTDLLVRAGARTGPRDAVVVDDAMATGLPRVWAAGDCVVTHHRLLGVSYLPLGTTAHSRGVSPARTPWADRHASQAASAPRS